jgi:hypothetical protein
MRHVLELHLRECQRLGSDADVLAISINSAIGDHTLETEWLFGDVTHHEISTEVIEDSRSVTKSERRPAEEAV